MTEFYDPLYGQIVVSPLFERIINTPEFRRLQYLRQLGICYLSFPGGNHTRFEHSLGVFHLANQMAKNIESSTEGRKEDRERISIMLMLTALLHDIGHGPFSHMTENILLGLGSSVNHEKISAALISTHLQEAFSTFTNNYEITPKTISSIILHLDSNDHMTKSVANIISSDLDLDKLDYLQRDSHYTGFPISYEASLSEMKNVWDLKYNNDKYYLELTTYGVQFAEIVLFLRRNNYKQIVFETTHMAATCMFEKAIHYCYKGRSQLKRKIDFIVNNDIDVSDSDSLEETLPRFLEIFGLVDFEALELLSESNSNSKYLINKIKLGDLFIDIGEWKWKELHYAFQNHLFENNDPSSIYSLCRNIEEHLAKIANIDSKHVGVQIHKISMPKRFRIGVNNGRTLADESDLGEYFYSDYLRQYKIRVFLDSDTNKNRNIKKIKKGAIKIFEKGEITFGR